MQVWLKSLSILNPDKQFLIQPKNTSLHNFKSSVIALCHKRRRWGNIERCSTQTVKEQMNTFSSKKAIAIFAQKQDHPRMNVAPDQIVILGKVSRKKIAVFLDFVQIASPPPPPPNLDNLYHFFNAKSVDSCDSQNDSLSEILLNQRQNTCFEGHVYNLKNSLKFKLLAFWKKEAPCIDQYTPPSVIIGLLL